MGNGSRPVSEPVETLVAHLVSLLPLDAQPHLLVLLVVLIAVVARRLHPFVVILVCGHRDVSDGA